MSKLDTYRESMTAYREANQRLGAIATFAWADAVSAALAEVEIPVTVRCALILEAGVNPAELPATLAKLREAGFKPISADHDPKAGHFRIYCEKPPAPTPAG